MFNHKKSWIFAHWWCASFQHQQRNTAIVEFYELERNQCFFSRYRYYIFRFIFLTTNFTLNIFLFLPNIETFPHTHCCPNLLCVLFVNETKKKCLHYFPFLILRVCNKNEQTIGMFNFWLNIKRKRNMIKRSAVRTRIKSIL